MTNPTEKWKAQAWRQQFGKAAWDVQEASIAKLLAEAAADEREQIAQFVHDCPRGSIVFCQDLAAAIRARKQKS